MDLIQQYGQLDFQLPFYTEVQDLAYLLDRMTEERNVPSKYKELNEAICDVVQDFSLVHFRILDVQNIHHVISLLKEIDKASGYVYGSLEADKLQETVEKMALNFDDYDAHDLYVNKEDN